MIENGTILTNGTETFTPIINRMLEIAQEFVPYIIYIAIGALGISLLWKAVKYIMGYLKYKAEGPFGKKGSRRNKQVKYNRKKHNYDEKHGKLRPEREYYE